MGRVADLYASNAKKAKSILFTTNTADEMKPKKETVRTITLIGCHVFTIYETGGKGQNERHISKQFVK